MSTGAARLVFIAFGFVDVAKEMISLTRQVYRVTVAKVRELVDKLWIALGYVQNCHLDYLDPQDEAWCPEGMRARSEYFDGMDLPALVSRFREFQHYAG